MNTGEQKVCFVVMGFGKKTDYESGRTLDLDATYEAIIKPAVEAANLRCIRADEVIHAGLIDAPMYEMLLRADLVIADISTGNVNAVYELGVRHALRPNSTIIMKESKGRLYFDLNHVSTFQYDHLGEDIGAREASRAKRDLELLIKQVIISSLPDSPVYSFLPNLRQPILSTEQYQNLLDETEDFQDHLSGLIQAGIELVRNSSFDDAVKVFSTANRMKPNDPYIIQQLTLATYKSKKPSEISALISALVVIDQLSPSDSTTLKRLALPAQYTKDFGPQPMIRSSWTLPSSIMDVALKFVGIITTGKIWLFATITDHLYMKVAMTRFMIESQQRKFVNQLSTYFPI